MSESETPPMLGSPEMEAQAHALVDMVIENARQRLVEEEKEKEAEHQAQEAVMGTQKYGYYDYLMLEDKEEDYAVKNITWPRAEEFNIKVGDEKINEFIKTWDYEGSWLYCIDFLQEEDHEYDKRYRYRVRWSIPTRRKPIPRATACVYFTIEVSKIKPKHFPVQVYYVFETNKLVHRPGQSRFREKWLKDIIESKIIAMETVNF
ncbi:A-kinase anchor protein 14-like [Branchiostoma lanceolatum]|uniref:A-kinase anchor protein 14-like n=1 Tax=Branchiostoma lanceolatum TaxID=7740 RepID=UPI003451D6BE